jgi:hypothetical protein
VNHVRERRKDGHLWALELLVSEDLRTKSEILIIKKFNMKTP